MKVRITYRACRCYRSVHALQVVVIDLVQIRFRAEDVEALDGYERKVITPSEPCVDSNVFLLPKPSLVSFVYVSRRYVPLTDRYRPP